MDARVTHRSGRASDLIPTYYDRPALKPSPYGFTVALYIYIGGLAAGAQIVSTVVALLGIASSDGIVLAGRVVALAGAVIGGILLIIDLHTKRRFYNMLRIFRPTSPMSIGTYVLMAFGFWSLLAVAAQLLLGWMVAALVCSVVASIAAWGMTTYTAALLAQTATPLWAAAPRLLAVRFASSAMATGTAALLLTAATWPGHEAVSQDLAEVAALSLLVQAVALVVSYRLYRVQGVSGAVDEMPWAALQWIGVLLLGQLAPIVLVVFARTSGSAAGLQVAAAVCVLVGGLVMRGTVLLAGNESAKRPRDYFRLAQEPFEGAV